VSHERVVMRRNEAKIKGRLIIRYGFLDKRLLTRELAILADMFFKFKKPKIPQSHVV